VNVVSSFSNKLAAGTEARLRNRTSKIQSKT
jgi:hypothetical protein